MRPAAGTLALGLALVLLACAPAGEPGPGLLLVTFGVPFVFCTAVFSRGGFGPNGVFCYFDGVNGQVAKVFFTTAPLVGAIVFNGALYALTWRRLDVNTPSPWAHDLLIGKPTVPLVDTSAGDRMNRYIARLIELDLAAQSSDRGVR